MEAQKHPYSLQLSQSFKDCLQLPSTYTWTYSWVW